MAGLEPDRKIIMAVDFGTTFSGLAWAQSRLPKAQTAITQWPDAVSRGLEGATSEKVPTEILYDGDVMKWGFQITGTAGQRYQWFKLGLDPSQQQAECTLVRDFPDPHAAPPRDDVSHDKLVIDYLTALRKHAEQVLKFKLPAGALIGTPIEYIITVPAVWTDAAQAKTRACAEKAGLGFGPALHIISEPEAAAIFALDATGTHGMSVGDTFVLCDAGGGTVDLISYKVTAMSPVLQITEAAPGSGSLCGSSFLNRIFAKFLQDKFGDDDNWDDGVLEEAMERFETTVKRQFSGIPGEEFQIPVNGLQDNAERGIRRSKFCLTGPEIRKIFEPVIHEVIKLIEGQIETTKSKVKAILLVGGFGQSAYLRERIKETVWRRNIESAVVRGALMKGVASANPKYEATMITGRSARKHYGVKVSRYYDPRKHDATRRYWDDCDGAWKVCVIDWFVQKGHLVEEAKPQRIAYHNVYHVNRGPPKAKSVPIRYYSDPKNDGPPVYEDNRVHTLVNVTADLSRLPKASFRKITGKDRKRYYRIEYEIEITYYSAHTKYELIYDEVNYGAVIAEYV